MSQLIEIKVPDIGDFAGIPVIEICAKVGDSVALDEAIVTLESDKATMDVPSSVAGIVKEIKVKMGDKLSEGAIVAIVEVAANNEKAAEKPEAAKSEAPKIVPVEAAPTAKAAPIAAPATASAQASIPTSSAISHASPSVRAFARELGVEV